jgi:modulator of FtsH protease
MNWDNFFIVQAGAAGVLTGLIFVAVSINISRIIGVKHLPNRALQSLTLLLNILIISSLMLVPKQSLTLQGIEVLAVSIVLWSLSSLFAWSILRNAPAEYRKFSLNNLVLIQLSVLPFIISGIMILCCGEPGIYWLVPGMLLSFSKAIIDAWVLLVEIHR